MLERASPDRQRPHHFLADLEAALPNTQASPTFLKLFMLEADIFLRKMLTLGGGLLADAGLSHVFENGGTLFADQVVQSMRLHNIFGAVTCVATKGTSLYLCNCMGAELFVDGRLNSCPSNPFMIPAWCVKIGKKTQQPTLERCRVKVKFLFSDHKNADGRCRKQCG